MYVHAGRTRLNLHPARCAPADVALCPNDCRERPSGRRLACQSGHEIRRCNKRWSWSLTSRLEIACVFIPKARRPLALLELPAKT